jgi:Ca2+-binding RTX toxin-like protein
MQDDELNGGPGRDRVSGGPGDDVLVDRETEAQEASDVCRGGPNRQSSGADKDDEFVFARRRRQMRVDGRGTS